MVLLSNQAARRLSAGLHISQLLSSNTRRYFHATLFRIADLQFHQFSNQDIQAGAAYPLRLSHRQV